MAPPSKESSQQLLEKDSKPSKFIFKYQDTLYDCTEYANKHPGGVEFFEKFITEK